MYFDSTNTKQNSSYYSTNFRQNYSIEYLL
uniref:Uncharacterized protein n=1 Tax=Myoviridae sp. ctqEN1 TaxID=2827709 RepID=A0A8S5S5V2_9CAUD|nr:MAG TPA: hypothetical protein [Myoviridae sp. ctqEN1]DAX67862.1 MAG TPA: hypothetical protein [Caudoviricetes sp.]